MGVIDLFSKRQKRARGEVPDVFSYDPIPRGLRVQVIHIWADAFGRDGYGQATRKRMFEYMQKILVREYGRFTLTNHPSSSEDDLTDFLLSGADTDQALDVIELTFKVICSLTVEYRYYTSPTVEASEAVEELNQRFREHGLGYRFEGSQLLKADAEYPHEEVMKPALVLLGGTAFKGPDEEFRKAHEHYLHGRMKESLNEALKALESTMKVICAKHGWKLSGKETVKNLIEVCAEKGLFPPYMLAHYTALLSTLESGVPTLRNKLGGHGQGEKVVPVPAHFVSYQLHLAASAILFLAQCSDSLKP